jgi:hypothetical protein
MDNTKVYRGLSSFKNVSPTPSNSSAMRTPENTGWDPDDSDPADEGDIQMEYFSD